MTVNNVIKTSLVTIAVILMTVINVNAAVIKVTGDVNYGEAWEVFDIVNKYREEAGLYPLTMDSVLMDAAMIRAAECSVYYSHNRPNGTECFSLIDVRGYAAENAAVEFESAADVVAGWMGSQGHKVNIVSDKFLSIGIGVFKDENGIKYWTQFFDSGMPRPASYSNTVQTVSYYIDVNDTLIKLNTVQNNAIVFHGEQPFNGEHVKISGIYSKIGNTETFVDGSKLLYYSSNTNVATVDSEGIVRPAGTGNAVISVYLPDGSGLTVTYNVTVTEHVYNSWNVHQQADCMNDGSRSSNCAICGLYTYQYVPATGKHDFSIKNVISEATCCSDGIMRNVCSVCRAYYESRIPATGNHIYDNGIMTIEPTETTSGVITYSCINPECTAYYNIIIPALIPKFIDEPVDEIITEPEPEPFPEEYEEYPDVIIPPSVINKSSENVSEPDSDIIINTFDPPLAMSPDLEGQKTPELRISMNVLPFIILAIIAENILLIIIVKKRSL